MEMPLPKGTIVIATLEGDVHDLGKNIFRMVLIGNGYRVVDCGKDCPLPKLMDVTEREQPLAIGVSGLITPVIPLVRQVKDQLALRRLDRVLVIAGGAALKQSMADKLNVDFVAESAFDGLHYLEEIAGGRK
jgi:methanogenic corrinoid protein MtbC1